MSEESKTVEGAAGAASTTVETASTEAKTVLDFMRKSDDTRTQPPPTDSKGKEGEAKPPETKSPVDGATGKPDTKKGGEGSGVPAEDDAEIRKSLGLKEAEVETLESLREKYAASSRAGREHAAAVKSLEQSLEKIGVRAVKSKDGKGMEFVATDKYKSDKAEEVAPKVLEGLTAAEKDMAVEKLPDFVKLIAGKVAEAMARPSPTISADEVELPEAEKTLITQQVLASKPNSEMLVPYLKAVQEDGMTAEFRKWMNRSQENFAFGQKALYALVHEAAAPKIARIMDERAKAAAKEQKAKDATSPTSEGGIHAQPTGGSQSEKDERDAVVKARPQW